MPQASSSLDLLRKLQGVQLQFLPIPSCGVGSPDTFVAQGCAAPGWDVADPAGNTELIQKSFEDLALALSFSVLLFAGGSELKPLNYVVVRKGQGPRVCFQIN